MRPNYNRSRFLRVGCLAGTASWLAAIGTAQAKSPAPDASEEDNLWPLAVESVFANPSAPASKSALGPLLFSQPQAAPGIARRGFRPFWVREEDKTGAKGELLSLYPFFRYNWDAEGCTWSVFSLIRGSRPAPGAAKPGSPSHSTEVWPFYLARHNPATGDDYEAVFPLRGRVTHRFGRDSWEWTLFPLYSRTEKSGRVIVQTPWPVFRRITGAGHHGVEVWPLYGQRARDGDYEQQFFLWPLAYRDARGLSSPVPERREGFLPFYAKSSGPGYETHTYGWPFFGWAKRTEPVVYSQKDYMWPLFVQGRGDVKFINRWAPFYSHSRIKGSDKHWFLWPLFRREVTPLAGMVERDTRLLFVVYRSTEQYRAGQESGRVARRSHAWPFLSAWEDGNGREQVQVLSPLEPLFPNNEAIRKSYSPLFALYRFQQTAPGTVRHSLLWDFITWQKRDDRREWHVGPLLDGTSGEQARFALLRGLLGLDREPGRGWRPFFFKFTRRPAAPSSPS
ncbi:hypothetical protein [Nibricoccus sp. IMCC34717]|uniref:hypothetical protein n=1 Tax=Nibricoccus sp. IMCC34717 TaxID=3034021 RepID=UPI00384BB6CE